MAMGHSARRTSWLPDLSVQGPLLRLAVSNPIKLFATSGGM